MNLAIKLRELRKEKGFTQTELAKLTGLATSCISMIEIGQREASAHTIFQLAKALNVSSDYLLGLEDDFGNTAAESNTQTGLLDTNEIFMNFSEIFTELRKLHGLTQQDISLKLGYAKNSICAWEKGRAQPNYETLIKIAKIFNVSIDYLLGLENDLGNVVISNGVKPGLEPGEEELIKNFRQLNMYQRDAISLQAKILAEENLKVIKK